jgi:hypothetical protein
MTEWMVGSKKKVQIKDMSKQHLLNAIWWIEKHGYKRITAGVEENLKPTYDAMVAEVFSRD